MKAQITAGLNFAVSGIPYWTMDIGGFCVENRYVAGQKQWNETKTENADYKEWRELNARWYQLVHSVRCIVHTDNIRSAKYGKLLPKVIRLTIRLFTILNCVTA